MANNEDRALFEKARFSSRCGTTTIGANYGKDQAVSYAKGLIQGGIDELITMLGEREAYSILTRMTEGVITTNDTAVVVTIRNTD